MQNEVALIFKFLMAVKDKLFNPEFIIVALFSIVAMIGVGFGMFFIGREQAYEEREGQIDELKAEIKAISGVQAKCDEDLKICKAELKALVNEKNYADLSSYVDPTNSLSFHYPTDWVLSEELIVDDDEAKGQKNVTLTSPNDSEFIYFSAETYPGGAGGGCLASDPDGEVSASPPCVFIEGDEIKFARTKELPLDEVLGNWDVAEDSGDGELFFPNPESNFKYKVVVEEDLELLDLILKSVNRDS